MAKKIPLTPTAVDTLNRGSLADLLTPGLTIEVLGTGKKRWRYRRKVAGKEIIATLFGDLYPAQTIAGAREWARQLNEQIDQGIDPRAVSRANQARDQMTVAKAHGLYMAAVREGRSSRAKRPNKPRTIKDKLKIYKLDIAPQLAKRCIYDIDEKDLIKLVERKGKTAKVRANRLAAELKVFFGWAASLRGLDVGLLEDPSKRLGDLRFPETPRTRKLSLKELEWFLLALVDEPRDGQRGNLLSLLAATRITEMGQARREESVNGVWTIPVERSKNSIEHGIALGPWGRSLLRTNSEWVFQAPRSDGPRNSSYWYKSRDRIKARMEKLAGHPIEHFTPHDYRRTARSNTKRLDVDFETAEAMLNHVKKGMERTYDLYEMEEEKRLGFLKWEEEIIAIAKRIGVAKALGVPDLEPVTGYSFKVSLPKRAGVQPAFNFGAAKPRAGVKFAQATTAKIIFSGETGQTALSQPVDLPT